MFKILWVFVLIFGFAGTGYSQYSNEEMKKTFLTQMEPQLSNLNKYATCLAQTVLPDTELIMTCQQLAMSLRESSTIESPVKTAAKADMQSKRGGQTGAMTSAFKSREKRPAPGTPGGGPAPDVFIKFMRRATSESRNILVEALSCVKRSQDTAATTECIKKMSAFQMKISKEQAKMFPR